MMIRDITDELPVHKFRKYDKRFFDKIEYIVLHHTATKGKPEAFARYHVSQGWPGIGYHYLISQTGEIYQTNRIDTISYNVGGMNTKCIGIAMIGNYNTSTLSAVQKDSISDLVQLIRTLVGYRPVKGHKDFSNTECPGKNIDKYIKELNR